MGQKKFSERDSVVLNDEAPNYLHEKVKDDGVGIVLEYNQKGGWYNSSGKYKVRFIANKEQKEKSGQDYVIHSLYANQLDKNDKGIPLTHIQSKVEELKSQKAKIKKEYENKLKGINSELEDEKSKLEFMEQYDIEYYDPLYAECLDIAQEIDDGFEVDDRAKFIMERINKICRD